MDAHPVGFAFTRLSIVDPECGNQPLSDDAGEIFLIANGEIYNHRELAAGLPAGTRLSTHSDCEVLLHLYRRDGLRFLEHVRGIYALAIWDKLRNRLILARDRFGIKPLYFARNGKRIIFSSEIKALFADPECTRALEWESCLADQMMTSTPVLDTDPVATWFAGVESVPAATVVEIDLREGRTRSHRYWQLPAPGEADGASARDIVRKYRELLRSAVADSCMSDAEVGLLLSGGIDSAAVAALSAGIIDLHTFTALNGGTLVNGDSEYAQRLAQAIGLPNHQVSFGADVIPTPAEWKRLLWLMESPLCGPEQFYKYELYRFARSVRPGLKVMLLGLGSDEFNGGYTTELAGGGTWDDSDSSLRLMARRRAFYEQPRLAAWWEHISPLLSDEFLGRRHSAISDPYASFVAWKYRHMQQYNCWLEDRAAAGNGIEARVPFLDHRLVELAVTIPAPDRRHLLWDKQLLRDAAIGIVPEEIRKRPKTAFYHGPGVGHVHRTFVRMLSQNREALLDEALASPNARFFLDPDGMRATLRALTHNPGASHVELLLRLVNLGLLDQMVKDVQSPPVAWPKRRPAVELAISDWDSERPRLEKSVLGRGPLPTTAVPAFGEDVLLLRGQDDGQWYLAVDGSLEYVLSESESPGWLKVLRLVDGRRSLAEILAATLGQYCEIHELLWEAVELGLLTIPAEDRAGTAGRAGAAVS